MNKRRFKRSKFVGFADGNKILETLYTKGDSKLKDPKQHWVQVVIDKGYAAINEEKLLTLTTVGQVFCRTRFPDLKMFEEDGENNDE